MKIPVTALLIAFGVGTHAAPAPGDRIPPLTFSGPNGASISLTPGRVAVISFVAFWCDTWKEQSRRLGGAQEALKGLPVQWLTVSVDGRWTERGTGKLQGLVAADPGRAIADQLGIHAIPYTLILDAQGVVQYAAQGIARAETVRPLVAAALEGTRQPQGAVYLTFDDFPSGNGDDALLDALAKCRACATFFCIGRNVEQHPDIVRRAASDGQELALHSWDHNAENPQLGRCQGAIASAGGRNAEYYRAPGSEAIVQLSAPVRSPLPYPTVNPYDYTRPGAEEVTRRVLLAAKPDCVILLHAGVSETVDALPGIISGLRKHGLKPATLPPCP